MSPNDEDAPPPEMASSFTPETNWSPIRGTLVNSITFDSSLSPSPIADDSADLNPTAKRKPLILQPAAPDSAPCEITINFTQKHELAQIYVKSSARVYEIYCCSDVQSEKEYLCTVRCGAALRDYADDDEAARSVHSNGSRDSSRSASEDEWIDVKVPNSSLTLIKPEFYEATAQMSDVNPCLSITIRLLSLQSKDIVFVDEVYVFADPADLTVETSSEAGQIEVANGNSSLMAMLMPTLLQMSKSKTQDSKTFETCEKPNFQEGATESEAACSSSVNFETKVHKDESLSTGNVADDRRTNDRVEIGLGQLFARMGRIEELFLRLERNLLDPINSIDSRLIRVEQQLEILANKPKNSEPPSCSRFCAPNFSPVQSDSNSFYRSETEYPRFEEFESNSKTTHSDLPTNQGDGMSEGGIVAQMHPSLIVTASEFYNCDDEDDNANDEEGEESENVNGTSVEEEKRPLTVDDALASALAGFVSSISIQAQNRTPEISVEAHDFPNDENTLTEKDSPRGQADEGTDETDNENGEIDPGKSVIENQSEKKNEVSDVEHEDESSSKPIDENGDAEFKVNTEANKESDRDETDLYNGALDSADKVSEDGSEEKEVNALHDILALSNYAPSVVDFESSILDVQFLSQSSTESSLSLNALFRSDFPEETRQNGNHNLPPQESAPTEHGQLLEFSGDSSEETSPNENHNSSPMELTLVEHGQPLGPAFSGQIFVDFNYCSLQEKELSSKGDVNPASNDIPNSHGNLPTSLI